MVRKRRARNQEQVGDYRHDDARRKNNPPAGIAPTYEVKERLTTRYAYDPHLDPELQWTGKAWNKLQRALKAQIDPEAFKQMRGIISFPF